MSVNIQREIQKWDDYYLGRDAQPEDPGLAALNDELVALVAQILPEPSKILEAGSGGGWHSLRLGRAGHGVTLLDFSPESLAHARRTFERERQPATFVSGDARAVGEPEYDLVFNAGVLEHYRHEEQVALLRGMASRSRRFVLALVPNRLCYWYWLWRVHVAARGKWPYGREVPAANMEAAFAAAGLQFLGQAFLGCGWTESLIAAIQGLAPELRDELLRVHRSSLLPKEQRAYLVAAVGAVPGESACLGEEWSHRASRTAVDPDELVACLSDTLALQVARLAGAAGMEIQLAEREARKAAQQAADEAARLQKELDAARDQLGNLSGEAEATASMISEYRASRRFKLVEAVRHLRRNPARAARAVSGWAWARMRHERPGLFAAMKVDDPLSPAQARAQRVAAHGAVAVATDSAGPRAVADGIQGRAGHVVMFAGVPFDDIGGGQRSAQLTRALLRRFFRVTYVYAFPKSDASAAVALAPGLEQFALSDLTPTQLLTYAREDARVIFEVPHRGFLPFLRLARRRGLETVFELIDDWQSSLGGDWFDAEVLRELTVTCERSVGTAALLVQRLREAGVREPEYLPNAADDAVFDADRHHDRPPDLPKAYDQYQVYFGSLYGEWFAWDYLRAAADRSSDKAFVIIGDARGAPAMPANVFFLGPRSNEQLPGYLVHAEAALIPFKPCAITEAVSPIKVYEYLHMRRPVVSGRMRELDGMPMVHQAGSAEEFAELCARVPKPDADLVPFITENSWDVRASALVRPALPATRFSFIVLIHQNRAIIGRCLDTLLRHTRGLDAEYFVVDNASTDGGAEFVEQNFPSVRLLRNAKNGCSSGRNLAARAATGDYLVFLDSDQWFASDAWWREAELILREHAGIGALGWAAGWFDPSSQRLSGPTMDNMPQRGQAHPQALAEGFRTDITYLGSGGLFIPRRVWQSLDGFDEAFDPTCFEDTDLSFQIRSAGFRLAYRSLSGIHHQAHQTTAATEANAAYMDLFTRNSLYLKAKWSGSPELFEPQRSSR